MMKPGIILVRVVKSAKQSPHDLRPVHVMS